MSKVIMVQGTMSNVGKSLLCAGLCRIFKKDGYSVAPFKSQNMALNSFITKDGLEMGRAQVMQAEAAGIYPDVSMNPILLKPTSDMGSQIIVNGKVIKNMSAKEYFSYKKSLIPDIIKAFKHLEETADIIVVEGAGSPAEINLKKDDIVNMGLAKLLGSNVLLAGDIDRGGVFAQLIGTLTLLEEDERNLIKGLIINKFRGDKAILDPGISMLEKRGNTKVAGVVPYMDLHLDDEDSLTERFEKRDKKKIDFAVIRYPRISNFTDFNVFEQCTDVSVRYVNKKSDLGEPDMIFLPGSKNTIEDLKWMRENGLEQAVREQAKKSVIFGICGGFQMLCESIEDSFNVESKGKINGMGLLALKSVLQNEKIRKQKSVKLKNIEGAMSCLNGKEAFGYEIHMGVTENAGISEEETCVFSSGNVYGTYLHGIFDAKGIAPAVLSMLAKKKNITVDIEGMSDLRYFKEKQYDKLEHTLRQYLDMEFIYGMLKEAVI